MEPNVPQPAPSPATQMPEMSVSHALRWTFISITVVAIGVFAWLMFPRSGEPVLPGGGATISAASSVATVAVGGQFTVSIILNAGQLAVTAADVVVTYDAKLLKATNIKSGTFLPVELAGGSAEDGRAAITVASGTTPVTGSGTIVTLTFQAIAPGQATIGAASETKISAVGQSGNVAGAMTSTSVNIR